MEQAYSRKGNPSTIVEGVKPIFMFPYSYGGSIRELWKSQKIYVDTNRGV